MERDRYTLATWAMWLALPATGLSYARVWDRLPARVAIHFDGAGRPNGWTSPSGALTFALSFTVLFLLVFTVAAYSTRARKPGSAWPVLILFYLVLGGFWLVSNMLVWRSLPT